MMTPGRLNARGGFVLIMTLWSLGFLTILALAVGMGTRQKIIFLGRMEARSQVQFSAEAGAKKAVAVLLDDLEKNDFLYTPQAKVRRHNNAAEFGAILLGGKQSEVVCSYFDEKSNSLVERYGLCDEHSKINLNSADVGTLSRLLTIVLGYDSDNAQRLAGDIVDWRDYGQRQAEGFFSDDYYKNLQFPYDMKEHPFERVDELFLVKGVSGEIYNKIQPFVTVYGDGRININTVSKPVLLALGVDVDLVDKVLKVRRGQDNVDATADDHVFLQTFDVPSDVNALASLEEKEMRQLDALNAANMLCTDSLLYSFVSRVISDGGGFEREILVVFDAVRNKYLYWYQK